MQQLPHHRAPQAAGATAPHQRCLRAPLPLAAPPPRGALLPQQRPRCRVVAPLALPQHHRQQPHHQPQQQPDLQQQQQQQQQQLAPCSSQRPRQRRRGVAARASGGKDEPPPSREDRGDPNKADFSAYWSLKFREFFSKRRGYLELSRKRQEPPEVIKRLDAQIAAQEEKLEAGRIAARQRTVEKMLESPELQRKAIEQDQQAIDDAARAVAELHGPRLKLLALTAVQLRAAVRAALLLPFTLPAAAAARWQALFAGASYEHFLLSEGERVWAFRNRTENERWFWEVFAIDRVLVPVVWTLCYQAIVPDNLLWSVLVPLCFITWQNGAVPGPGQLEWWLIMVFGLCGKCWHQVTALAALLFKWW